MSAGATQPDEPRMGQLPNDCVSQSQDGVDRFTSTCNKQM